MARTLGILSVVALLVVAGEQIFRNVCAQLSCSLATANTYIFETQQLLALAVCVVAVVAAAQRRQFGWLAVMVVLLAVHVYVPVLLALNIFPGLTSSSFFSSQVGAGILGSGTSVLAGLAALVYSFFMALPKPLAPGAEKYAARHLVLPFLGLACLGVMAGDLLYNGGLTSPPTLSTHLGFVLDVTRYALAQVAGVGMVIIAAQENRTGRIIWQGLLVLAGTYLISLFFDNYIRLLPSGVVSGHVPEGPSNTSVAGLAWIAASVAPTALIGLGASFYRPYSPKAYAGLMEAGTQQGPTALRFIMATVVEMIPGGLGPWGVGDVAKALEGIAGRTLDGLRLSRNERIFYLVIAIIPLVPALPIITAYHWLRGDYRRQSGPGTIPPQST
jgi:hypothetical protein